MLEKSERYKQKYKVIKSRYEALKLQFDAMKSSLLNPQGGPIERILTKLINLISQETNMKHSQEIGECLMNLKVQSTIASD